MDERKKLLNDMFGNPVGEFHGAGKEGKSANEPERTAQTAMRFHMGTELDTTDNDSSSPVKPEDLCPHF